MIVGLVCCGLLSGSARSAELSFSPNNQGSRGDVLTVEITGLQPGEKTRVIVEQFCGNQPPDRCDRTLATLEGTGDRDHRWTTTWKIPTEGVLEESELFLRLDAPTASVMSFRVTDFPCGLLRTLWQTGWSALDGEHRRCAENIPSLTGTSASGGYGEVRGQIWMVDLTRPGAGPLPGGPTGVTGVAWRDDQTLLFTRADGLYELPLGGAPRLLHRVDEGVAMAPLMTSGGIFFVVHGESSSTVERLRAGRAKSVATVTTRLDRLLAWRPDVEGLLALSVGAGQPELYELRLGDRQHPVVEHAWSDAVYLGLLGGEGVVVDFLQRDEAHDWDLVWVQPGARARPVCRGRGDDLLPARRGERVVWVGPEDRDACEKGWAP